MFHIAMVIGFFIAVGAVVGLLARLVTVDSFRLSLPQTVVLGAVGAAVASLAQWWALAPDARQSDSGSWAVPILGAITAMVVHRAWARSAPPAPAARPADPPPGGVGSPGSRSGPTPEDTGRTGRIRLPAPQVGERAEPAHRTA